MEAIGFERRLERFPWISYNSLVTITFFIPYCLGKIAATVAIQYLWRFSTSGSWRDFERWQEVAFFSFSSIFTFLKGIFCIFHFLKGGLRY